MAVLPLLDLLEAWAVLSTLVVLEVASGVDPLANVIEKKPTFVTLAFASLVILWLALIADGSGFRVLKSYIDAAAGCSIGVELFNMAKRNAKRKQEGAQA